jgi:cytoskeletal protein RodZ
MGLETVGEILKAEREKRGISIKDVEKGTSIRSLYIQAIEDGDYAIVPGEVYLKGFIRNYATFLGLDGQEMVKIYRQSQLPPEPPVETPKPQPERKTDQPKPSPGGGRWVPWLIGIIIVACIVWGAASFFNQPAPPTQPSKPAPQTPATPAPTPTPKPQAQVTPAPAPTPQTKPVTIVAKYTAQAWTQVTADGKDIYEGIPKVGETLTWTADKTITIKLGNAAGVDITYNGQPQGKLGGDGDVITKTYSANTTNIQKP